MVKSKVHMPESLVILDSDLRQAQKEDEKNLEQVQKEIAKVRKELWESALFQ